MVSGRVEEQAAGEGGAGEADDRLRGGRGTRQPPAQAQVPPRGKQRPLRQGSVLH